jgi:hypothetical protein
MLTSKNALMAPLTGQNKLRGYGFYVPGYMNVVWIIKSGMSLTPQKGRNFF